MVTEEQQDAWGWEFLELETELTVFELRLLLLVADTGEGDPWEPVMYLFMPQNEGALLTQAPFLSEGVLLELARQQRLLRLGLLYLLEREDGTTCLALTEKGTAAARWWTGMLWDVGFRHDRRNP